MARTIAACMSSATWWAGVRLTSVTVRAPEAAGTLLADLFGVMA